MMSNTSIEFAISSNGDRWFLESESNTEHRVVIHKANLPSGGAKTTWEIADFLKIDRGSPQHSALLELLASLPTTGLSPDQEDARLIPGTR